MKPGPSGDVKAFALVNGRLAGSYGTTLSLSTGRPTAILIEDGKIRSMGMSNFDLEDLKEAQAATKKHPVAARSDTGALTPPSDRCHS